MTLVVTIVFGVLALIVAISFGLEAMPDLRGPIERGRSWWSYRRWAEQGYGLKDVAKIKSLDTSPAWGPMVFSEWTHRIDVTSNGDAAHEVSVLAINLADSPCDHIDVPLYGEVGYVPMGCWAKFDKQMVDLTPREWDSDMGLGYLRIPFAQAVNPNKKVRFRWGYSSSATYGEGDEWFEWHISQPARVHKLVMNFDRAWEVSAVKGSISASDRAPAPPTVRGRTVRWTVLEPPLEKKLRLDFVLKTTKETRAEQGNTAAATQRVRGIDREAAATRVFYSYAHEDEDLRRELETHLKILQRGGLIEPWTDRRIGAGDDWRGQISDNLERADIVLLLVSANFIDSDYCWDIEMTRALERHEAGEAKVIPVIVRDVSWQTAPFGRLNALPVDGKPVDTWRNRDTAWRNIAEGIEAAVEAIRADDARL